MSRKTRKAPPQPKLTEEMRQRILRGLHKTWDYIKYDAVQLSDNNKMTADEIQEVVPDYFYRDCGDPDAYEAWKALSFDVQDDILRQAFPRGACL